MNEVKRLSGIDAFFLYVETPTMHTHVVLTAVLDPATSPEGYSFERISAHIAERLHLVPPFRRRAVDVPLKAHHPIWVDDADFDIHNHVHAKRLSGAGDLDELSRFVAEVAAEPLDRRRPLWEMWIVEGLADDRIALVAKIHHSAMDGGSGVDLMPVFFDLEPSPPARETPPPWEPADRPHPLVTLGEAGIDRIRGLTRMVPLLRRTGGAIDSLVKTRRTPDRVHGATPLTAPRTGFNGPIDNSRSVAFARLPLPDIKRIKNAFGATVNDVLLATCAGALRRYMDSHGGIPDRPLVTVCPVSTRTEDQRGVIGNHLSAMFTSLHTDLEAPDDRLRATAGSATAAKEEHEALGADTLSDWAELMLDPRLTPALNNLYTHSGLSGTHPPAANLVLSNMVGTPFPVYLAGCRMEYAFPMGPVMEGIGLNITVLSYCDHVDFGFLAAGNLIPDVGELAAEIPSAFDELLGAAGYRGDDGETD